jgi:hypothetical protein
VVNATPQSFYLGESDSIPIVLKAGWVAEPTWKGAENLVATEIRSPDRPSRSEFIYGLSYPGLQPWRTQEFCGGTGGGSPNSVENRGRRERGSGGGSPLVRSSGGNCNLVQEISFHIVKFS